MKNVSFHKSILLWFSLAFIILGVIGLSGYQSLRQLNEQKGWVDHTYKVIDLFNTVLSDLKDVTSAIRGYAITGEQQYLTPYNLAMPELKSDLDQLQVLVTDNPTQQERLKRVVSLVAVRLDTAGQVISLYDTQGQEKAFDFIKTGKGQREMGELRILITQMTADEYHLLDLRQKSVTSTLATATEIGSAGLLICAIILILVLTTIYRESSKRETIEVTLQKALSEMEQVSQQTIALSKLSDYLQSCQSIDEAYSVIDNTLPVLMPGVSGTVSLFKNSRNMVDTVSRWGPDSVAAPKDFAPDQCWGLRRGRAHYFVPGGTEPCCAHFAETPGGASLCLPMQAQGETIGLFSLVIDSIEKTSKEKVAFSRRVSEQIALAVANLNLQKKLLEQSIRDPLTKLFNRRYLEATLEREIKRAERNKESIGVLVLDIDYFKKFNDTMGHDAGDSLLARFAGLLEQNVRKEDIVCRYGGEEFVIVLPKANLKQACDRAEKICEATRQMKISGSEKISSVSVSIGVSEYPLHGILGPDLVTVADSALYRAKHNGRDRVMPATDLSL